MSDDRLREAYSQALNRSDTLPLPTSACVTPEQLLALVRQEGSEEQRLATLDHVMACGACRRELDLLRAIEHAGARSGVANRRSRGWQRFAPLGLAASLLLAVGIGMGVRWFGERSDLTRGGRSLALLSPPGEISPGTPVTFAWARVPYAHQYVFELLTSDSAGTEPILSQATPDTTLVLEPNRLKPGEAYQWWVRARTPAGELTSGVRRLRVRSQ